MRKESSIEAEVVTYSKVRGCLQLKLLMFSTAGWPDRLFLYMGHILFIEFKLPGEKPTRIQVWTHNLLRKHLFRVEIVDNVEQGKVYIDELIKRYDPVAR